MIAKAQAPRRDAARTKQDAAIPAEAPRGAAPSLVHTLTLRLVLITTLAMALQAAIVAVRDYYNGTDFLSSYVRRAATAIGDEVSLRPVDGNPAGSSRWLRHYVGGPAPAAYAMRVVASDGTVIAEHNGGLIRSHSPWTNETFERQDFWLTRLDPGKRMHVAGGMKTLRDGRDLWVEVATLGDPGDTYLYVMAVEILDDVLLPLIPLMVMSVGVIVLSVRRSLRPLSLAARRADAISIIERGEHLEVDGLPQEVTSFATATNRLLDRVVDLVAAQRLFIARAAHELRTPLSIMLLELGNLTDPRAKHLESDVRAMSEIVDRLLTLARLQGMERPQLRALDLAAVARTMVERMQVWAERDGHTLSFEAHGAAPIQGDETALREAVRNLIENAVRHTPTGTRIRVEVATDASLIIEDSGPGIGLADVEDLQRPFRKGNPSSEGAGLGLAIVRQSVDLHNGRLQIGRSPLGGARFVLSFPRSAAIAAE